MYLSPTMIKAIYAVHVLALACLFALSTVLPSMLNQTVSAQTQRNATHTLPGKYYRKGWDSQGCPPSRWTLAVTGPNDANANPDHASAHQAQIGNSDWTQTKMNTKPRVRLPLVLNTLPESGPARLRLTRSKRPTGMWYSHCSDDAPPSEKVRSNGMATRDEDEQHVQSPVISRPEGKKGSREVSVPVRRSKRSYSREEWKSRLFEEY